MRCLDVYYLVLLVFSLHILRVELLLMLSELLLLPAPFFFSRNLPHLHVCFRPRLSRCSFLYVLPAPQSHLQPVFLDLIGCLHPDLTHDARPPYTFESDCWLLHSLSAVTGLGSVLSPRFFGVEACVLSLAQKSHTMSVAVMFSHLTVLQITGQASQLFTLENIQTCKKLRDL